MAVSRVLDRVGLVLGGRYRLLTPIGTGASASVYAAEDAVLRRMVAVKVLHAALADDEAFLRRFRAEAHAAAALNHPHVMAVYDWGQDTDPQRPGADGIPYLVMEYLGGGSLRAILDLGSLLTPSQALLVGLETARGLEYAHRRGFVHRDIKPANLLFDDDARLRIADFGLARALAEAAWTEPMGAVLGTARYASPEQARGESLDGKSDVYSLALVMIEAVSGRVPFAADTTIGTLMARVNQPLVVPDELEGLRDALAWAGHRDPLLRPDASEFGAALMAAAVGFDRPAPLLLAGTRGGFDLAALGLDPTETTPIGDAVAFGDDVVVLGDDGVAPLPEAPPDDPVTVPAGDPAGGVVIVATPIAPAIATAVATAVAYGSAHNSADPGPESPVEERPHGDGEDDGSGVEPMGWDDDVTHDLDPIEAIDLVGPRPRRRGRLRSTLPFTAPAALPYEVDAAHPDTEREPEAAYELYEPAGMYGAGGEHAGVALATEHAGLDRREMGDLRVGRDGREVDTDEVQAIDPRHWGDTADQTGASELSARQVRREMRAERKATRPPRRKWPAVVAAMVVLVAAAGGAGFWYTSIRIPYYAVPGLVGGDAATIDSAVGRYRWVVSSEERFDDQARAGIVLEQKPAAGTEVPRGGSISVVVSKGPPPVEVPTALSGQTLADATAALASVGLAAGPVTRIFDENVALDTVIAVAEGTPSKVTKGGSVGLVVSDGPEPRTIPDGLVGKTGVHAVAALKALNLRPSSTEEFSDSIAEGNVISVDPGVGSKVPRDSAVTIVVSKGPPLVAVPDVAGKSVDDAATALEAAGFEVSDIQGSPRKKVTATDPVAGTKVKPGSSIKLITSAVDPEP